MCFYDDEYKEVQKIIGGDYFERQGRAPGEYQLKTTVVERLGGEIEQKSDEEKDDEDIVHYVINISLYPMISTCPSPHNDSLNLIHCEVR